MSTNNVPGESLPFDFDRLKGFKWLLLGMGVLSTHKISSAPSSWFEFLPGNGSRRLGVFVYHNKKA